MELLIVLNRFHERIIWKYVCVFCIYKCMTLQALQVHLWHRRKKKLETCFFFNGFIAIVIWRPKMNSRLSDNRKEI